MNFKADNLRLRAFMYCSIYCIAVVFFVEVSAVCSLHRG